MIPKHTWCLILAVSLGAARADEADDSTSEQGSSLQQVDLPLGVATADDAWRYAVQGRSGSGVPLSGQILVRAAQDGVDVSWESVSERGQALRLRGRGAVNGERLEARLRGSVGIAPRLEGNEVAGEFRLLLQVYAGERRWRARLLGEGGVLAEVRGERGAEVSATEAAQGTRHFVGRPFVQGAEDGRLVHPSDTRQGALGDCYVISALIATARTDPDVIERMIRPRGPDEYSVYLTNVGYLYQDSDETVTAEFPYSLSGEDRVPVYAKFGDTEVYQDTTYYEMWGPMIEKAYAQYWGGYERIGNGGSPSSVFQVLSGKGASIYTTWFNSVERIEAILTEALAAGHPVCVGTVGSPEPSLNLVGKHAYVVWAKQDGGFQLYNPWGHSHPSRPLTATELNDNLHAILVGNF